MSQEVGNRLNKLIEDLGIEKPFVKGVDNPVFNCWHFYTDGNSVESMFWDESDFIDGMNRIYNVFRSINIDILAFSLMDTHIHFILHGELERCRVFIHEYIRRTSMHISTKHGLVKILGNVKIHHQPIDTDRYLKTAICYTFRNATVGGLRYNTLDYPWSSAPLMFKKGNTWASPLWMNNETGVANMSKREFRTSFKTRRSESTDIRITCGIVFPGEYVNVKIVERLFRSPKGFHYYLCNCKESDIEARGGIISRLSIPIQEMREYKKSICLELFGKNDIRTLDTAARLKLARVLKSRYNSSDKQIIRLCGLIYDEAKFLL